MVQVISFCSCRHRCTGSQTRQWHIKTSAGLQITVGHRTWAEQNLLMSDERLTVVGRNARTLFLREKKKFTLVTYVVGPLFHSLMVAIYIFFKWQNIYLSSSFFSILLFLSFCMSDQNSDLAGHMSFQKKKITCSP